MTAKTGTHVCRVCLRIIAVDSPAARATGRGIEHARCGLMDTDRRDVAGMVWQLGTRVERAIERGNAYA